MIAYLSTCLAVQATRRDAFRSRRAPRARRRWRRFSGGGPEPAPPAAAPQPTPGALLLAKQIVQVKNVKDIFQPIVRGVVQKAKDGFLQTNFMWSKDLNEVAVNVEKQFDPRVTELVDASARIYATHFTEQELQRSVGVLSVAARQKVLARRAESARREHGLCRQLGGWSGSGSRQCDAR